jgi:DNA polymerase III subunit beta
MLTNMSASNVIKVGLQDSNSSALLTVPDLAGFKYVVMPMRI